MLNFPEGFVWGAATASYQVEGAVNADGRGESIWDRFAHTPGKTYNGDTGDVACDHYHRYADDVRLMADLGLHAYRFSIAWPRILPTGKGQLNERGLDFYDRLVDALCGAGIKPFVTLYHWDLPQALEDSGGWMNRDLANHFAHYADVVSRRLGDRVEHWMTLNEPMTIAFCGYITGEHAPGHRDMTMVEPMTVLHNLYLAHGQAVRVLRAHCPECKVGAAFNMYPVYPATPTEADQMTAYRCDMFTNRLYVEPILKGEYPAELMAALGPAAPRIEPGDMRLMSAPLDFMGVNYYSRMVVAHNPDSLDPLQMKPVRVETSEYTDLDWEIYPDGLHDLMLRVHNDYHPQAIYIMENGCAMPDILGADGQVHDPRRVAYLRDHFRALQKAITQGAPIKGYFAWTLMDNFEWSHGYNKRFGLIYVDYPTQRRIPKDSAHFYRETVKKNAVLEP